MSLNTAKMPSLKDKHDALEAKRKADAKAKLASAQTHSTVTVETELSDKQK